MLNEVVRCVELRCGLKIPMRDGVHLAATLYMPKPPDGPVPYVITLTPYVSDSHHEYGVYFAKHGLGFVVVDVRGRGNSEGLFQPYIQEARDGYDVVSWLAREPRCNGKVAMWGGSYLGYVQWATAKEFPRELVTIVPTAAPYIGVEFPLRNNIFYPFIIQWIMLTSGRASQSKMNSDATFWSSIFREWHESGRPFRHLDTIVGNRSSVFQEWLSHPYLDEYWDAYNPSAHQYSRLEIPILTITGSYDDDQPGALAHYREHMSHASAAARAQHFLVIGPWDHRGTGKPSAEFGGLKFGMASVVDLPKLHLQWYAWVMQTGPKPEFLKKQVCYYVMGAERWRYSDTLEGVTVSHQCYFLNSKSNADDIFSSGFLDSAPGAGNPDTYRYDPRDTSGPEVEAEANTTGGSLTDQSVSFALCGRQLVYHSRPFSDDTEISGFFKLSAWISIDCPDTDLYVSVHEIGSDGSSIRLSTDAIRARYREGLRAPKLIPTQSPLRYDFTRFAFVSRQIKRGHRLRLIIAPIGRLIEATFAEKNFNGGGIVAEESAEDARPVTVSLFHDEARPSALYVPLGRPISANENCE